MKAFLLSCKSSGGWGWLRRPIVFVLLQNSLWWWYFYCSERQITSDDLRGGLVGAHWCPAFCVAVINIWGSCLKAWLRGSSCLFHKVYLSPHDSMEPPRSSETISKILKCCPTWRSYCHAPFVLPLLCSSSVPLSPSFVSQAQPLCWLFFCSSGFICF